MELGHEASAQLMVSFKPTGDSVHILFLHTNLQLSSAINNYLCASFLAGKIKADGDDKIAIQTFISVFNRMALETIELSAQMKTAAQDAEDGKQGMSLSMADGVAKILQGRKEVGTDLQNVIVLIIYLTYDASDKTAKVVDTLSMSARERSDLLKRATALASRHPCRRVCKERAAD